MSQPGTLTVPAHMLHDIVRKLPDGAQIELKRDGDKERLTLTSGHSRFSLQTLSAEDFPDLAVGEIGHEFTIDAADLKRLIEKTRFAISTEETRYYLNGIYFHTAETGKTKTLRAVATDGHRLAQVELPRPQGADGMPGVIIPRKTVHELARLLEDTSAKVEGRRLADESTLRNRHRGADVEADRRHVPRLWPRHSAQQRQGDEGRRTPPSCRPSIASRRSRASAGAR